MVGGGRDVAVVGLRRQGEWSGSATSRRRLGLATHVGYGRVALDVRRRPIAGRRNEDAEGVQVDSLQKRVDSDEVDDLLRRVCPEHRERVLVNLLRRRLRRARSERRLVGVRLSRENALDALELLREAVRRELTEESRDLLVGSESARRLLRALDCEEDGVVAREILVELDFADLLVGRGCLLGRLAWTVGRRGRVVDGHERRLARLLNLGLRRTLRVEQASERFIVGENQFCTGSRSARKR